MKKLSTVKVGESANVNYLQSKGPLKERMLALGLTKGAKVKVIRVGPRKNLTVFNIRGVMIALRSEESSKILVN